MSTEVQRPDPNALLAAATAERRGRLKIFLGAAPGVGKTYAMLEAARARRADGVDVVIGIVETHGRAETAAMLEGFEILPRRRVIYRDHPLEEFDLDAALTRRPALLLVDELAHTNAEGSRHPKRYQDVEELLAARIEVWTTLNIQHLESLNDIVAKITHVRVRETLPDSMLQRADEVELVDLTPEDLLQRVRDGKVYKGAMAERAAANFFQPGNLTALRELALRRTAERVDDQMVGLMRQQAIAGPWPAGERILACVSPSPDPDAIVRAARRLADQIGAKWTAIHFETPRHEHLDAASRERIRNALRLAERLGGDARSLPAADLVTEILRVARNQNITQIVLGKTRRARWREMLGPSLVHELLRANDAIAVHIVPADEQEPRREQLTAAIRRRFGNATPPGIAPYLAAAGAVVAAAFGAFGLWWALDLEKAQPLVFLAAVLFTAIRFGMAPSIVAAILSVLIYDFFFIPPHYTLTITDPEDVLLLGVFVIVALLTSNLAARVREQAREARRRFKTTANLYDFARKLADARALDDLCWVIVHQIATMMNAQIVLLLPEDGRLTVATGYPPEDELAPGDWAAANWAWTKTAAAGRGSDTLPGAERYYLPLRTGGGTVGVLGLRLTGATGTVDPDQRRMLDALLDQAALAIERLRLDQRVQETRVLAESEKLRSALLSSISHDLGTPLSAIIGAVTTLRFHPDGLPAADRGALLETIHDEATRLARFVTNLVDMTKIEGAALQLRRDWIDLRELVGSAVARIRRQYPSCEIRIDMERDLPLLRLDYSLFEQVFFNLMDNAAKYGGPTGPLTIRGRRDGRDVVAEVIDAGPGIPVVELERVFEKFHRLGRGPDPRWGDGAPSGTGLGLAICRGIVEAHQGTIHAESPVSDGCGTRLVIRLPVEAQPASDPPMAAR